MSKEKTTEQEIPMRKVRKTSITKAELAELPAETFSGSITVVTDEQTAAEAVKVLKTARVIGFDTETRPSFRRGEHHDVSLLQLSTHDRAFLFRLNLLGLPECIAELLEDDEVTKIGVSIHDDFMSLRKKYDVEPSGFIDLQNYVKEFNIADNSLSRIYGILFDKRISKGQRLTNWEASELTAHQQEYAALDAVACVTIYRHLRRKGFDHTKSKYFREFEEPA